MIDLAQTYEQAGLFLAEGELPDYLPVVLEFASTQPPREARAFLGEMAHIFNVIFSALHKRQQPPTPACSARCSSWPARQAAAGEAARRSAARRELGRAGGLRRLLDQGPGRARASRNRSTIVTQAAAQPPQERVA